MTHITLSDLDPLITSHSLLQHPFYRRWSTGSLTVQDLQVYAKEYYHFVRRIPAMVERVRDRASDTELRERIEMNRREEEDHVELWARFAKSLGIDRAELDAHCPSDATRQAVDRIAASVEGSFDAGVASLYALELELPAIAQTKMQGLTEFYGLSSADAQAYFEEHLAEEKHLAVWRSVAVEVEQGTEAASAALAGQHAVLDAVCVLRGIPCHCS